MADAVGINGLHKVSGVCDLCGCNCDAMTEELNALDCTYANCPPEASVYHQTCLEKYLKSIRLEKNRKTGFKCPRGCGKATGYKDACPGRVDKSHPIHVRNEDSKAKRQAVPLPQPSTPPAATSKGPKPKEEPARKGKDKKEEGRKMDKERDHSRANLRTEVSTRSTTSKHSASAAKAASPRTTHTLLAAAAAAARRELGLDATAKKSLAPVLAKQRSGPKEVRTLEEYEGAKSNKGANGEGKDGGGNAWASRPAAAPQLPPPRITSAADFPLPQTAQPAAGSTKGGPPEKPQGAWAQKSGAAVAATAAKSSVTVRAIPIPVSAPAKHHSRGKDSKGAQHANGTTMVLDSAAELNPEGFPMEPRMTRSHRKANAAERKKGGAADGARKQGEASDAAQQEVHISSANPTQCEVLTFDDPPCAAPGAGPDPSTDHDALGLCLQMLMARKAQSLIEQLQQLGFLEWQCVAAVQRHGSNLEAAVQWLLEGQSGAEVAPRQQPEFDLGAEVSCMQELQAILGLLPGCVERVVIDCQGDVEAAAVVLFDQCMPKPSPLMASPHQPMTTNSFFSTDAGMMRHPGGQLPQVKVGWVEEHVAMPFSPVGSLPSPRLHLHHHSPHRSSFDTPDHLPLHHQQLLNHHHDTHQHGQGARMAPGINRRDSLDLAHPFDPSGSWSSSGDSAAALGAALSSWNATWSSQGSTPVAAPFGFTSPNAGPSLFAAGMHGMQQQQGGYRPGEYGQERGAGMAFGQQQQCWPGKQEDGLLQGLLASQNSLRMSAFGSNSLGLPQAWLPDHPSTPSGSSQRNPDAPEAALFAAATVTGEGQGGNVMHDDLELDTLMATLMCR